MTMMLRLLLIFACVIASSTIDASTKFTLHRQFESLLQNKEAPPHSARFDKKSNLMRDAQNRMRVFEALAQDLPWSGDALYKAAIIFQHTNTENEPLDNEEFRSQEMHLLTFFILRESRRLLGEDLGPLLGIYRYLKVSGLSMNIELQWERDTLTQKMVISKTNMTDAQRLKLGFPIKLQEVAEHTAMQQRPTLPRKMERDAELAQLYTADQQTRSLFKKEEMIFNRYIERVGDAQRRARLYELISEDILWNESELYFAAKILNKSPSIVTTNNKKKYQLQENHLLAFFLARQAHIKGHPDTAALMMESMNSYIAASRMLGQFKLQRGEDANSVCQSDPHVSVELWGKYEFPFHLGRAVRGMCLQKLTAH